MMCLIIGYFILLTPLIFKCCVTSTSHDTLQRAQKDYGHDIYMNYASPIKLSYGHVELSPKLFTERLAKQHEGRRYKGMVIWADRNEGYGEHYWDMTHGALE